MKCIGVFKGYRLYYDEKYKEYLLLTPNFKFTRMFGHCNNEEVTEWAYKEKEKYEKYLKYNNIAKSLIDDL